MARFEPGRSKTGGRTKGTLNKAKQETLEAIQGAFARVGIDVADVAHITPLEAMRVALHLAILNRDRGGILQVASAMAPYIHPKLAMSEVRVQHTLAARTTEDLLAEAETLRRRLIVHEPAH
jgi:hypothetical protein